MIRLSAVAALVSLTAVSCVSSPQNADDDDSVSESASALTTTVTMSLPDVGLSGTAVMTTTQTYKTAVLTTVEYTFTCTKAFSGRTQVFRASPTAAESKEKEYVFSAKAGSNHLFWRTLTHSPNTSYVNRVRVNFGTTLSSVNTTATIANNTTITAVAWTDPPTYPNVISDVVTSRQGPTSTSTLVGSNASKGNRASSTTSTAKLRVEDKVTWSGLASGGVAGYLGLYPCAGSCTSAPSKYYRFHWVNGFNQIVWDTDLTTSGTTVPGPIDTVYTEAGYTTTFDSYFDTSGLSLTTIGN